MNLMLNVFVGSLLASLCVAQSKLQFEFKVILRVYSHWYKTACFLQNLLYSDDNICVHDAHYT